MVLRVEGSHDNLEYKTPCDLYYELNNGKWYFCRSECLHTHAFTVCFLPLHFFHSFVPSYIVIFPVGKTQLTLKNTSCIATEYKECSYLNYLAFSCELRDCFISSSLSVFELQSGVTMRRTGCAAYHIEHSIATRLGLTMYPCACTRCRGACIKKMEVVARHHFRCGRDCYLIYPIIVSVHVQVHSEFLFFSLPMNVYSEF